MSPQHDYVIDNSTGANVRSDINSVLQAIASNNSGSSAPSTTYAFQLFADTTNNVMKIRNSANNAFIELFQLDGTFTLEDGSASTPALAFRDDLNTGIFSSAADTFNVATGGVERMELGTTTIFNEDGADVDFRIEGDSNANLFYVDAGNNRIGIGTNSPTAPLTVADSNGASNVGGNYLLLERTSGTTNYIAAPNADAVLDISADETIRFGTVNTGDFNSTERMRIDSSGKVGIGTTSPETTLSVDGGVAISSNSTTVTPSGYDLKIRSNTCKLGIHTDNGSDIPTLEFGIGNANGGIITTAGAGALQLHTNSTERMRIDSSGSVFVGKTSSNVGTIGCELHASGLAIFARSGLGAVVVNRGTNNGTVISLQRSGTEVGTIAVTTTNTSYNQSGSDRSLKKNFEDWTENTLNLFKNIKPQKFNFIVEEDTEAKTKGYIAQDLVDSFPEAYPKNDDDKYMFNPSGMVVYLMKAIQELEAKVAELEAA